MATLRQNQFSPRSNIVVSIGTASVAAGSPIDALAGNDRITGIANDATPPFDTSFEFGGFLVSILKTGYRCSADMTP
jgi:hypothetical protein